MYYDKTNNEDEQEDEEVYQLSGDIFQGQYTEGKPTYTLKYSKLNDMLIRKYKVSHEFTTLL